jgi:energy-coupling factor transporter ATP-binding protein EcfA2
MRCVASSYVYASDIQSCAGYVTQQGKDKAMRFIELTGVRAQIGETKIPHDINLTMDTGDVYGFIGPNDAGKSTTITVMTGPIPASRGVVSVLKPIRRKVPLRFMLLTVCGPGAGDLSFHCTRLRAGTCREILEVNRDLATVRTDSCAPQLHSFLTWGSEGDADLHAEYRGVGDVPRAAGLLHVLNVRLNIGT